MATAFVIDYQPTDATMGTSPAAVVGLRIGRSREASATAGDLSQVLGRIEQLLAAGEPRLYTIEAGYLLAHLLWHRRQAEADRILQLIDERRIVSVEDIAAVYGIQGSQNRYVNDDPVALSEQGPVLLEGLQKKLPRVANPATHPGGINIETFARTVELCLSWRGFRVDVSRLTNPAWSSFAAAVRFDGTAHPFYTRSRFGRIHTRQPNAQNMTLQEDSDVPPRSLVIPSPGSVLIDVDIQSAELEAVTATWKRWFSDDPRVLNLSPDTDHHHLTGSVLAHLIPCHPDTHRQLGKAVNFCLINGGRLPGVNAAVSSTGAVLNQPQFNYLFGAVNERLPLDAWLRTATDHYQARTTTTIAGRQLPVETPSQFSAAHLQSLVADCLIMGLLEMCRVWIFPSLAVYDQMLFESPHPNVTQTGVAAFHRGLQRLIPWRPGLQVKQCSRHWGAPDGNGSVHAGIDGHAVGGSPAAGPGPVLRPAGLGG